MCVREREREREVTGSHLTVTQNILSFAKLQLDATSGTPPTLPAKSASSRLKNALLQSVVQKLDHEVGLRVAAKRLPKRSSWESRLSVDGSRR